MNKKISRRQWFLGMVGAVLGAGAARAVDRWLPGGKPQQGQDGKFSLSCISSVDNGVFHISSKPLEGKVIIEQDAQTGHLLVEVRDRQGRLVQQICHPRLSVQVHRGSAQSPGPVQPSHQSSPPITYSYDSSRKLQTITDPLGPVTTYVYDANGDKLADQT
jgi:YD repeat-containing protein